MDACLQLDSVFFLGTTNHSRKNLVCARMCLYRLESVEVRDDDCITACEYAKKRADSTPEVGIQGAV